MVVPEIVIRLGAFALVLGVMALWEALGPRRPWTAPRGPRWLSNLGLVVIATVVVRLVMPLGAVGMAHVARDRGWGLLNAAGLHGAVAFVAAVVALDLVIYVQHVVFHYVPALWRLHKVHHTDLDFDASTGVRFHPVEIAVSMALKLAAAAALGPPPAAVVTSEILLSTTSLFNHGNVALPAAVDRVLRWLVVTPDMHRVHHSVHRHETNSNFGFNLPWWDHLFRTYRDQPEAGHLGMTIGLEEYRDPRRLPFVRLLLLPFERRLKRGSA